MIGGGYKNCLGIVGNVHADHSVISGGCCNVLQAGQAGIASGFKNFINTTGSRSFIGGGANNAIHGTHSAILGGSGNTVAAGYDYVGIFGCNITAGASNTFYTECLNACSTPLGTLGPFVAGTIYYLPATATPPPGAKLLYIQ